MYGLVKNGKCREGSGEIERSVILQCEWRIIYFAIQVLLAVL
jgi:hypothetical protein